VGRLRVVEACLQGYEERPVLPGAQVLHEVWRATHVCG
jgi:hypothetical protein